MIYKSDTLLPYYSTVLVATVARYISTSENQLENVLINKINNKKYFFLTEKFLLSTDLCRMNDKFVKSFAWLHELNHSLLTRGTIAKRAV